MRLSGSDIDWSYDLKVPGYRLMLSFKFACIELIRVHTLRKIYFARWETACESSIRALALCIRGDLQRLIVLQFISFTFVDGEVPWITSCKNYQRVSTGHHLFTLTPYISPHLQGHFLTFLKCCFALKAEKPLEEIGSGVSRKSQRASLVASMCWYRSVMRTVISTLFTQLS